VKQPTFIKVRNHTKRHCSIVESGKSVRVLHKGKPSANIAPVMAELPSWKRHKVQPLMRDGVSISRMVLEEREASLRQGMSECAFY